MVRTASTMLPLGTTAPDFSLPSTDGDTIRLADFADRKALLVIFWCNHCPFVKHVADEVKKLGDEYLAKGVGVVAISSNDAEKYPDDDFEAMKREKDSNAATLFRICLTKTSRSRKLTPPPVLPTSFCLTPNRNSSIADNSIPVAPGNDQPITGKDLRSAIDAVLAGQLPSADQTPSIGCNIKWKPGNEPQYFNPQGTA